MKYFALTLALLTIELSAQVPYIGGNDLNSLQNNPNTINAFLKATRGQLEEACKSIPGVGKPVLALKQCT